MKTAGLSKKKTLAHALLIRAFGVATIENEPHFPDRTFFDQTFEQTEYEYI